MHIAGTGRALGVPHVDSDYFHQPAELNYWLPLTPCWGGNTLWCESRQGAADYKPFELQGPGRYQRFWGNQLRHFTLPNGTGSTRVSFDLRCVPLSLFVPDWKVRVRMHAARCTLHAAWCTLHSARCTVHGTCTRPCMCTRTPRATSRTDALPEAAALRTA